MAEAQGEALACGEGKGEELRVAPSEAQLQALALGQALASARASA